MDADAGSGEGQARALLQRVLDGFNSGDIAAIADCFHRDVRAEFPFAPPGMSAGSSGHDAVIAALREGRASFEQMTITPARIYWCAADATLFLEASSVGRLRGGGDYRNSYIFVVAVREGRIILWREYFDSHVITRAMATLSAGVAA